MESLVVEEVEKQIQKLPSKVAKYIKLSEVVAYALNRLPSLYATSKKGWHRQVNYGKNELHKQISVSVRQGIAAVQRDPLRVNDPLNFAEDHSAVMALEKLKTILQCEDISWEKLPDIVEKTLINTSKARKSWGKKAVNNDDFFDWNTRRY
ncbi:MAG: late competence development ComFB family protein [Sphaerospermopsis sp. SIO1G2]|nr:late competence development ComFB family protein [Sphaerospermopsis sp. SIO1G1]NET71037.1 late competence development ComFB family protein [Sphaerospermopsis sp. SIO1G2]